MKLLLVLISVLCFSCGGRNNYNDKSIPGEGNTALRRLKVVVLDGCEYYQFLTHGYYAITHKGNCRNTFHSKQ